MQSIEASLERIGTEIPRTKATGLRGDTDYVRAIRRWVEKDRRHRNRKRIPAKKNPRKVALYHRRYRARRRAARLAAAAADGFATQVV